LPLDSGGQIDGDRLELDGGARQKPVQAFLLLNGQTAARARRQVGLKSSALGVGQEFQEIVVELVASRRGH
jgi:hypothetical protein